MRLMPKREVDFEPSIYDSETGLPVSEFVSPSTSLMTYENKNSSSSISYIIKPADIHIYFRENKDAGEGTSLSISFYDPSWNVIDPRCFNETSWNNLFQAGFFEGYKLKKKLYMIWPIRFHCLQERVITRMIKEKRHELCLQRVTCLNMVLAVEGTLFLSLPFIKRHIGTCLFIFPKGCLCWETLRSTINT